MFIPSLFLCAQGCLPDQADPVGHEDSLNVWGHLNVDYVY